MQSVETPTAVLVGLESSGKSSLAAGLTGHGGSSRANFRGSTVAVLRHASPEIAVIDTPGLIRQSDSETTRLAVEATKETDATMIVVVRSGSIDHDLASLLPIVAGRPGIVVVTFGDKVDSRTATRTLENLSKEMEVPVMMVDARDVDAFARDEVLASLQEAKILPRSAPTVGWSIEPRPGPLEWPRLGPILSALLLLAPAVAAVLFANTVAGWVEPVVDSAMAPLVAFFDDSGFLADVFVGDYGLLTMFPLLFVWAVPTVVVYAGLMGAYKASGLVDRLAASLHPAMLPVGIEGRDLVRVLMGLGCNVPAVVSTRSCAGCTRDTTIAAIAFGSACSYQMGATLAVFAAAGSPALVVPFLLVLAGSMLIYARLTSDPTARRRRNLLLVDHRSFLSMPRMSDMAREASVSIRQFFATAIPIFLGISVVASLVDRLGLLDAAASALGPIMAAFNLPTETALAVVLASVRKDGLLLLASDGIAPMLDAAQLLTAVYLAGVLLPCLVTVMTIARERSVQMAGRLVARQAVAAIAFSLLIAWIGAAIISLIG